MSNPAINDTHSIAIAIDKLTRALQSAIESSLFSLNRNNSQNKLPDNIQNKITEKNRPRCEWQRTGDPLTKQLLNSKVTFIRAILQTHKQDQWNSFLTH